MRTAKGKARVVSPRRRTFSIECLENRRTLDGVAPYVVEMTPQAAGAVFVRFSEDVVNLDVADFRLTKHGASIDLALASLQSQSPSAYTLQLPALADGLFDLTLASQNSEIADLDGDLMVTDASVQVLIANQPPSWQIDFHQADFNFAMRRVAALGDSMTVEGGGSYVSAVRDLLQGTTAQVDTFANAAWKAEHLVEAWETQVRDAGYDTIVVFAGVPDLNSNSTADSIFQSLRAIYDDALARGTKLICIGVSPWAQYKTWTIERYVQTTRLNDLISQYVTAHPTMARYVDTYALLGSSDMVVRLAPSMDSGDGRHLSPVGAERLAQAVSTAVLSLDTPTRVQQSMLLTFSRPVFGLGESHLKLTYFGNPEPAQLVPLDSTSYRIDFSVRAKSFSAMSFNLDMTQGPITDQFNQPVPEQVAVSFNCAYGAPQANVWSQQPWISAQPMEHVRLTFNGIVSTLVSDNFVLRRDGEDISPLDLTISRLDDFNFNVAFLASQTSPTGTYQLLFQPRSDTRDSVGNLIRQGASVRWIKLAVEPQVVAGVLQLAGTDGPDNLVVSVNQDFIDYTINGVFKSIPRAGAQRIVVEPGAMQDLVTLSNLNAPGVTVDANTSDSLDRAYLFDGSLSAVPGKSTAYLVQGSQLIANGFAQVTAISRSGRGSATLIDSSGVDKLESRDQRTTLKGPGYEVNALGYSSVTAYSQNGSVDTADLYDSEGNDTVSATMAAVTVQGLGYDRMARNFGRINVHASTGHDTASLVGSTVAEKFVGQPSSSAWSSGSQSRYFYGFDFIDVIGLGGLDQATLYGSTGADAVQGDTRMTQLINSSSQIRTYDFPRTNVFARTGLDTAIFLGREQAETFVGRSTYSLLTDGSVTTYVYGFDEVTAAGSASDSAKLYGTAGNDGLVAMAGSAQIIGNGFNNKVLNFGKVSAYAEGGSDVAQLTGTAAVETLTGKPAVTSMVGAALNVTVNNFARVFASSGGGDDVATFRDGPGIDVFTGSRDTAEMFGSTYRISTFGYRRVNAYSSFDNDVAQMTGSNGNDTFTSKPETSSLVGSGYKLIVNGFDRVSAVGGGGTDLANLYDSQYDDVATVGYQSANLKNYFFDNTVTDFDRIQLYASLGNDVARLSGTIGNDTFVGTQTAGTLTSTGFVAALQRFDTLTLLDSQGGLDQVLLNSIAYQLVVGLGWTNG